MPLVKLEDFDQTTAKVLMQRPQGWGSIQTDERLAQSYVDEEGHFRYFIVDLASGFSAKVLLPVDVPG